MKDRANDPERNDMLRCPPPRETAHHRRSRYQRDWRRRANRGEARAWFTYDATVVEFLLKTCWLDPAQADDRAAIGDAVSGFLQASVRQRSHTP
jgi:hypothetical protein